MKRCTHCNKLLSPSDIERPGAKCHRCRKGRDMRRRVVKGPGISLGARSARQGTSRQDMLKGSGVSWWTAYACGERRDQDFQAEAERRFPMQPQGLVFDRRWPKTT